MKNRACVASEKNVFLIAKHKNNDKLIPADEWSIAGIRARGKSGLLGTAYRLMTGRSNPTIRATVTKRLKNRVKRAISMRSNLE